MSHEDYDIENSEEWLDEVEEDLEDAEKDLPQDNPEIPDVWWAEDIAKIENSVLQEKAIEKAEKLVEERKELDRKLESREIDEFDHLGAILTKVEPKELAASVEASLATVDLTWDKLADLSENHELVVSRDLETLDRKEKNKALIREVGVEKSQEITDRLLEEEKIDEEGYQSASRLVRSQK